MAKAVKDIVRSVMRGEIKDPDLREVAAHFFHVAGGPRSVAKLLYDQLQNEDTTPMVRMKILDLVMYITKVAADKSPPREELSEMDMEDLERLFEKKLGEIREIKDARAIPTTEGTTVTEAAPVS